MKSFHQIFEITVEASVISDNPQESINNLHIIPPDNLSELQVIGHCIFFGYDYMILHIPPDKLSELYVISYMTLHIPPDKLIGHYNNCIVFLYDIISKL